MLSHKLRRYKAPAVSNTDPNFNQVSLLLHGDGTNGAQNNTFIDSSTNNFTITRTGNTTQGTNTPFSQPAGAFSNFFDGTGDYFTTPANAAFDFGTGDWTVECWFYLTGDAALSSGGARHAALFSISSSIEAIGMVIAVDGDATTTGTGIGCYKNLNTEVSAAKTITLNKFTWYHVAVTKSSSSIRTFINGTQAGSPTSDSTAWGASNRLVHVGRMNSSSGWFYDFPGYISNLRVVKGTAVYTADFTAPTAPLTAITNTVFLTCQSSSFKDNSSNNFALTAVGTPSVQPFSPFAPTAAYSTSVNGGSLYFDGTGDLLSLTNSAALQLTNSTAFTIECWVYRTSTANSVILCRNYNDSSPFAGYGIGIGVVVSNNLEFWDGGGSWRSFGTIPVNAWTHIAVSYTGSGTTGRVFINGVQGGSSFTVSSGINRTTGDLSVGAFNSTTNMFPGYISNFRLVKGTALYTANFTPPTAPLTAITNTSLLLNGTNAGIFDNAAKNDLETVGNSQVSTSVTKFGTGSMSFDGTGDWLIAPNSPNLQLGTGNFTIEGWVYLNAVGAARGFVSKGTSTTGWSLGTNSSNQVVFGYASSTITSSGTLAVSTWYFVTVVREGTGTNQTKIYINGTNDGTGTVSTNFNQTNIMYVGANRVGGDALNGYIDDLRITNGVARYTATFTPPTAAFPNQ